MKLSLFIASMVAALVFCGCQDTVNTIGEDARFITDGFLRDRLALQTMNVSNNNVDGLKSVQLTLVNVRTGVWDQFWSALTGENPYPIRYKFIWFNKDGMAVETLASDWQDTRVIPGEILYLQSVAPTKDSHDFKLSLKEAN